MEKYNMQHVENIFIILHFSEKAIQDTFECVASIKKNVSNENSFHIVIVENGSNDNSEKLIIERYEADQNLTVLISDKNLGFAKGNNLGCQYAIKKFEPEFLIILNNDTIIKQEDFLEKLREVHNRTNFHVLGPYIYDRNLKPQNPKGELDVSISAVERSILKIEKKLSDLEKSYLLYKMKYEYKTKIKRFVRKNEILDRVVRKVLRKEKLDYSLKKRDVSRYESMNVALHGSVLIFSRDYYMQYDEIFNPRTFLYFEENILYYRVLKDKLISIYSPELKVYHKEDRSTNALVGESIKKQKFILKHKLDSLEIFKKIINGN